MAARFVDVSESGIDQFKENAVPQKTKEATNLQCNSTKTINRLQLLNRVSYEVVIKVSEL